MIYKKKGRQSVIFEEKPLIRGRGTVVGLSLIHISEPTRPY